VGWVVIEITTIAGVASQIESPDSCTIEIRKETLVSSREAIPEGLLLLRFQDQRHCVQNCCIYKDYLAMR
jgi:hypothetical protein